MVGSHDPNWFKSPKMSVIVLNASVHNTNVLSPNVYQDSFIFQAKKHWNGLLKRKQSDISSFVNQALNHTKHFPHTPFVDNEVLKNE